jgi:hypothetical protein
MATLVQGQEWLRYDANVLPSETEGSTFDLTDLSQDAPGTGFVEAIMDDPDIAGNSVLYYVQPDGGGTKMYRFNFQDTTGTDLPNTQFTMVTRVKGLADWEALGLRRVFDFQLRNGAVDSRDELRLGYESNRIELDRADVFVDSTLDLQEWHIFRMTADGDLFTVYVDENPTPVLSMVSTVGTGDRYLKIGDGSSDAVGGYVDWVAFDTTGAYNPLESPLDASFSGVGKWLRYEATKLPSETGDDPFDLSGLSQDAPGAGFVEAIMDDPDIPGNSLLAYIQPEGSGTKMYRFDFADSSGTDLPNTQFTVVSRIKGLPNWEDLGLNRVFDIQLRNGAVNSRDELRLGYGTNRIELDRADVSVDSTIDMVEWHIYRMTADGDLFTVYIDEDPTPVLSMISSVTTGDRYLKIGDGSSDAIGGYVDWCAIDTTGAYSPEDSPLDMSFTGYPPDKTSGVKAVRADVFKMKLFPNPVQEMLNMEFTLERPGEVRAILADMATGRVIEELINTHMPAGAQTVQIPSGALAPGSYVIQLQVDHQVSSYRLGKVE